MPKEPKITALYLVCEKFEFGIFHCPCSLLGVSDGRAISDEYRTQTVRFRSYWLPVLLTLLNWSTTMRPFCPQFVIFRLEKKAMAKTKAEEKALNLDQILFNCRDYLRAARNSGSFFEKRDIPRSTAPKFSKRSWNR